MNRDTGIEQQQDLSEMSLEQLQQFSGQITGDVFDVLTLEGSVAARDHIGGTAPAQVRAAAARALAPLTRVRRACAGVALFVLRTELATGARRAVVLIFNPVYAVQFLVRCFNTRLQLAHNDTNFTLCALHTISRMFPSVVLRCFGLAAQTQRTAQRAFLVMFRCPAWRV